MKGSIKTIIFNFINKQDKVKCTEMTFTLYHLYNVNILINDYYIVINRHQVTAYIIKDRIVNYKLYLELRQTICSL